SASSFCFSCAINCYLWKSAVQFDRLTTLIIPFSPSRSLASRWPRWPAKAANNSTDGGGAPATTGRDRGSQCRHLAAPARSPHRGSQVVLAAGCECQLVFLLPSRWARIHRWALLPRTASPQQILRPISRHLPVPRSLVFHQVAPTVYACCRQST